jgi:hypothetical protein
MSQSLTVKGKTYKVRYFTEDETGLVAVLDAYEDPNLKGKFGDEWPMVADPKGKFVHGTTRVAPAPA